ncbi:hypothetical protein RhiJN_10390 [Ceratobasidium sp. AG-Ba]|nr:hypothetical protein RhiJN_10390 [Ceratobasidium sp. AG-Ba]
MPRTAVLSPKPKSKSKSKPAPTKILATPSATSLATTPATISTTTTATTTNSNSKAKPQSNSQPRPQFKMSDIKLALEACNQALVFVNGKLAIINIDTGEQATSLPKKMAELISVPRRKPKGSPGRGEPYGYQLQEKMQMSDAQYRFQQADLKIICQRTRSIDMAKTITQHPREVIDLVVRQFVRMHTEYEPWRKYGFWNVRAGINLILRQSSCASKKLAKADPLAVKPRKRPGKPKSQVDNSPPTTGSAQEGGRTNEDSEGDPGNNDDENSHDEADEDSKGDNDPTGSDSVGDNSDNNAGNDANDSLHEDDADSACDEVVVDNANVAHERTGLISDKASDSDVDNVPQAENNEEADLDSDNELINDTSMADSSRIFPNPNRTVDMDSDIGEDDEDIDDGEPFVLPGQITDNLIAPNPAPAPTPVSDTVHSPAPAYTPVSRSSASPAPNHTTPMSTPRAPSGKSSAPPISVTNPTSTTSNTSRPPATEVSELKMVWNGMIISKYQWSTIQAAAGCKAAGDEMEMAPIFDDLIDILVKNPKFTLPFAEASGTPRSCPTTTNLPATKLGVPQSTLVNDNPPKKTRARPVPKLAPKPESESKPKPKPVADNKTDSDSLGLDSEGSDAEPDRGPSRLTRSKAGSSTKGAGETAGGKGKEVADRERGPIARKLPKPTASGVQANGNKTTKKVTTVLTSRPSRSSTRKK